MVLFCLGYGCAIQTEEDPETSGPWSHGHGHIASMKSAWEVKVMLVACITTGNIQQILPRLLWESCYEALPLKEELAQLSTLVSEQTRVNVASNKTRTAPIIDLV